MPQLVKTMLTRGVFWGWPILTMEWKVGCELMANDQQNSPTPGAPSPAMMLLTLPLAHRGQLGGMVEDELGGNQHISKYNMANPLFRNIIYTCIYTIYVDLYALYLYIYYSLCISLSCGIGRQFDLIIKSSYIYTKRSCISRIKVLAATLTSHRSSWPQLLLAKSKIGSLGFVDPWC